jgi:hypothetical protein
MATTTKKTVDVTVLPITTPATTQEQQDYALVADLIDRGMQRHPTWKQAHGTEYRSGRASTWVGDSVTAACAMGFAKVGGAAVGELSTDECFAIERLAQRLIRANDKHKWSLRKIVHYLRLGAKAR